VYGKEKAHQCIYELDIYKKAKGVDYYSDYDAIKRWVLKRIDEQSKKSKDIESKKVLLITMNKESIQTIIGINFI